MKLSVIIVNYNVKYFLEQAVLSVRKASKEMFDKSGYVTEVFVVDNNSVDGSLEMLDEKFPEVKVIANKKNLGFSAANNQAIRISNGEYVLLLNPDTVVEEDTFLKCVRFMDQHPDAGGLGVKMVDGKGEFLPESKRGLPTPWVAFYKISGLASLFPKSKKFGKYHLGYFGEDDINEVEILSGAFMLMRKEALVKAGLLDETFFMYGEDIDLSYRLILAGYKNYYFPDTRIIHYKGESTKKSSINYVFIFYNAMIIFAKKHFSQQNAQVFSFLINIAIYLRASVSVAMRFVKKVSLPALDFAVMYLGMYLLKSYWESTVKYIDGGEYPVELMLYSVPAYILFWMAGVFLSKGYHFPYRLWRVMRGVAVGTVAIAFVYAFLPEHFRYSRALIVMGGIMATLIFSMNRYLAHYFKTKNFHIEEEEEKRIVVVGKSDEANRVHALLEKSKVNFSLIGFVQPQGKYGKKDHFIGRLRQLDEIIEVYNVNEVVFCAKDVSSQEIISQMVKVRKQDVHFKIVPEESYFIIGSSSKDKKGDFYTIDFQLAIASGENVIGKRFQDVVFAMLFLLASPLLIIIMESRMGFIKNIFNVLSGRKTWVGYVPGDDNMNLPPIRQGILTPADKNKMSSRLSGKMLERLNFLYARDYTTGTDRQIIFNNLRKLGNTTNYEKERHIYRQGTSTYRAVQPGS